MTHPLEHLAPYVDGALAPSEQRRGRRAPALLCAVPRRGGSRSCRPRSAAIVSRTRRTRSRRRLFTPERIAELTAPGTKGRAPWAKAAPALAAAAVVALVALAVPRLGTSSDDTVSGGIEAADTAVAPSGPVRLALDDTDYDVASLQEAATAYAASLTGGDDAVAAGATPAEGATAVAPPDEQLRFAGRARTAKATRCLRRAFPGFPGEIAAARLARFEGSPGLPRLRAREPRRGHTARHPVDLGRLGG